MKITDVIISFQACCRGYLARKYVLPDGSSGESIFSSLTYLLFIVIVIIVVDDDDDDNDELFSSVSLDPSLGDSSSKQP